MLGPVDDNSRIRANQTSDLNTARARLVDKPSHVQELNCLSAAEPAEIIEPSSLSREFGASPNLPKAKLASLDQYLLLKLKATDLPAWAKQLLTESKGQVRKKLAPVLSDYFKETGFFNAADFMVLERLFHFLGRANETDRQRAKAFEFLTKAYPELNKTKTQNHTLLLQLYSIRKQNDAFAIPYPEFLSLLAKHIEGCDLNNFDATKLRFDHPLLSKLLDTAQKYFLLASTSFDTTVRGVRKKETFLFRFKNDVQAMSDFDLDVDALESNGPTKDEPVPTGNSCLRSYLRGYKRDYKLSVAQDLFRLLKEINSHLGTDYSIQGQMYQIEDLVKTLEPVVARCLEALNNTNDTELEMIQAEAIKATRSPAQKTQYAKTVQFAHNLKRACAGIIRELQLLKPEFANYEQTQRSYQYLDPLSGIQVDILPTAKEDNAINGYSGEYLINYFQPLERFKLCCQKNSSQIYTQNNPNLAILEDPSVGFALVFFIDTDSAKSVIDNGVNIASALVQFAKTHGIQTILISKINSSASGFVTSSAQSAIEKQLLLQDPSLSVIKMNHNEHIGKGAHPFVNHRIAEDKEIPCSKLDLAGMNESRIIAGFQIYRDIINYQDCHKAELEVLAKKFDNTKSTLPSIDRTNRMLGRMISELCQFPLVKPDSLLSLLQFNHDINSLDQAESFSPETSLLLFAKFLTLRIDELDQPGLRKLLADFLDQYLDLRLNKGELLDNDLQQSVIVLLQRLSKSWHRNASFDLSFTDDLRDLFLKLIMLSKPQPQSGSAQGTSQKKDTVKVAPAVDLDTKEALVPVYEGQGFRVIVTKKGKKLTPSLVHENYLMHWDPSCSVVEKKRAEGLVVAETNSAKIEMSEPEENVSVDYGKIAPCGKCETPKIANWYQYRIH